MRATTSVLTLALGILFVLDIAIMLLFAVYGMMTVILVSNLWYLRDGAEIHDASRRPRVSVLVPARNEARNLELLIPSLLRQTGVEMRIVIYDDGSTDDTWDVIQSFDDERLEGIRGEGPPTGWLGKTHALWQCARRADGDVYLFLDADTRLVDEGALGRILDRFLALPKRSVMSAIPDWSVGGGQMLVSLASNSVLLSIPWLLVNRLPFPGMTALNGQCWMIRASDYHQTEPHEARKHDILEDVEIGRYLRRQGFNVWMISGRAHIAVRMYDSITTAWLGLRKNAYLLFGGEPLRFMFASTFSLGLFLVGPSLVPALFIWQIALKAVTDRVAGFRPHLALLAPVSYLLGWLVAWDSFAHHIAGTVTWKDRDVTPDRNASQP